MTKPGFQSLLDSALALGVLLALETQLRAVLPVAGPGEILLAAWIAISMLVLLFGPHSSRVPALAIELVIFWTVFAFALSLGFSASIVSGEPLDLGLVVHDVVAYSMIGAISILLAMDHRAADRLYRLQWKIVLAGTALMIAQLADAASLFTIPGLDPWYWDRLRAWADNPNQYALFCLLLGLMALSLFDVSPRPAAKSVALVCAIVALGGGWFAKSNAFVIWVLAALIVFAASKCWRFLVKLDRPRVPAIAVCAAIVAAGLYVGIIANAASSSPGFGLISIAGGAARQDKNGDEEAAVRLQLWRQALNRGTADSWFLGLGPGPHLPIPGIILSGRRGSNEPANTVHPNLGLAANFEAHNTILELYVQGGAIAVASFVSLAGLAAWRSWRAGYDGLLALLVAMLGFGMFHVIFRHPLVWVIISCALAAPSSGRWKVQAHRIHPSVGPDHAVVVLPRNKWNFDPAEPSRNWS